jgi:hypothetical protein
MKRLLDLTSRNIDVGQGCATWHTSILREVKSSFHILVSLTSAKLGAATIYVHIWSLPDKYFYFSGSPLARKTRKTNTEGTPNLADVKLTSIWKDDLTSRNIDVCQVAQHLLLRYWFFVFSSLTEGVSGAKLGAATIYVHNGLSLINIFISMALRYRGKLEKPIHTVRRFGWTPEWFTIRPKVVVILGWQTQGTVAASMQSRWESCLKNTYN